jgi:hypothetical protein
VPALHVVREVELHVVAEIVETELVVRAVSDVAGVGDLPFLIVEVVLNHANRHPQEPIDTPHPFRVAACKVIVHGDNVNAFPLERIQVGRQRRNQRLPLARFHLGDFSAVQNDAAYELHVEMAHVQRAAAGFADYGEGLREKVLERLAGGEPMAELVGLRAQLFVGELLDPRFQRVNLNDKRPHPLQFAVVCGAENFGEDGVDYHAET